MSEFVCEPLGKKHDRDSFNCGVSELNDYLRTRARQDMRRRVAAAFVLAPADNPRRIAGYYTLSSASVVLAQLPDGVARKLPKYPTVPAVLIGRLARDLSYPGTGKLLLLDALSRAWKHSSDVAAAVVLVDTKHDDARRFYAKFGFQAIPGIPQRMFLPIKTIENLLKS